VISNPVHQLLPGFRTTFGIVTLFAGAPVCHGCYTAESCRRHPSHRKVFQVTYRHFSGLRPIPVPQVVTTHRDSGHRIYGNASDKSTLMKNVGRLSKTLQVSTDLGNALNRTGKTKHFRAGSILFHAGDRNAGIFLVCQGKVCLQVPGAPHLNRQFPAGSVLGLPSTFVRKPYSLTAACVTECVVAHVGTREFLDVMASYPDLCLEATNILSREVAFIFSALGRRSHKLAVKGRHGSAVLGRTRQISPVPA